MANVTRAAREQITKCIKESDYTFADVATLVGVKRQELNDILKGKYTGGRANDALLALIKLFKIRL
ncbi:MAG: hypothetical protein LBV67_07195 [Streptococcaceae bacterium]|jgi:predicted XRE-type DNA-binding protein|nr:hypothetical protein [Streptococcaceae bacterium]